MTTAAEIAPRARRAVRLHDDPRASAAAAGLRYMSDTEPGLTRVRRGRGFSYLDDRGRPASRARVERIRKLVIPPAWTQVWICPRADGHLQATGLDDRGRKQYLYHPRWRELRDSLTFERLALVGSVLPQIRAEVADQLRRRTVDRNRVLAGMLRLLDITGIRIGNEVYERDNHSIGLTTLRWSHVTLDAHAIHLSFPAKSGQAAEFTIRDRPLVRLLGEIARPRRRRVFAVDGSPLRPEDLNAYLSHLAGAHVTAKDFRTWRGTVVALDHLLCQPNGTAPTKRACVAALDAAADALRNTRAVARAHYVHPGLLDGYLAGLLVDLIDGLQSGDEAPGPERAEHALLALLPALARQDPLLSESRQQGIVRRTAAAKGSVQ